MVKIGEILSRLARGASLLALAFLASLAAYTAQALPGPTSAAFDKGALFTVAGYEGSSSLTGFPVLVRIAENSPAGFSYTNLHNGIAADLNDVDIAFVGLDGAGLPYEIDTWNTNGTSLIWVKLPAMEQGSQFVMCWGSDSSGRAVCSAKPWSDYTGVWHMNEAPAGVTTIHDSTANELHGTAVETSSSKTDGMVGRARFITSNTANAAGSPYDSGVTIDMTDDAAKLNAVNAIVPEFTASFWVRPQNNAQWWYFITRKAADKGPGWGLQNGSSGNNASFKVFRAYGNSENDGDCLNLSDVTALEKQKWVKLDAVWMSDKTFKLYVNGICAKEGVLKNQADNGNQTKLAIGGALAPTANDQKSGRGVYGDMDEVRLRVGALAPDWIAADCATVTNAAFLTAGTAEEYEANNGPLADIQVSDVGYTNAVVTATVYSRGAGAASADVTVEIAVSTDFASPIWATKYTVVADDDARVVATPSLALGTTYYVRAVVSNNLDAVVTTPTATFTTPDPGPVFSASVITEHIVPDIFLSFANPGFGSAVTQITVEVSASGDFTSPDLTKTLLVNLAAMPTNVNDISLMGLPSASPLYYRFTAVNSDGHSTTISLSGDSPLDGNNVWSGLSEDIEAVDAYVFSGGLPGPGKTLYFTSPAGLSPVIDQDSTMPALRFTDGKSEAVDTSYLNGYHSCGYDMSGSGVLTFSGEKPILHASLGTNVVRNPILFDRPSNKTVYVTSIGGRLDLTGELMLPEGVTNTTMRVGDPTWAGGELHFGGPSPDFTGRLYLEHQFTLSLDNPNAMTNVSSVYFGDGWGSFTHLKNNTGAPMTFPRCAKISNTTGWSCTRTCYAGAPFIFPIATLVWCPRESTGSTIDADLMVKNLEVAKHGSNGNAVFDKVGGGTLAVMDTTRWDTNVCKHLVRLRSGCFWAMTDAGLPPSGEFYITMDQAWQSTIGLNRDFYPMLDGSSTPRMFQESKWASWGFTGFGGEHTVCWNADPTLNLTNTASGAVSIPLGDAAHTNANGKAYSDYYAYPAYLMFGNRSEFADGTILFLNPIRYELGQEWDTKTFFESTNHVVAARLRGSLRLGSRNKTWTFTGRKFGGYLALEADNADFNGNISVTEKGNLLVNSNLVARAVTVQAGCGLGGTGSIGTTSTDGTTVKSGGSLFGGEWNKGGTLTLGDSVKFEGGSALRVEVGASSDSIGLVKLAADSALTLTAPIYVDVDTDPAISPAYVVSRKILDWSEVFPDPVSAPPLANFVARPERNPDLRRISISIREDGLYVGYVSVRQSVATIMTLR